MRARSRSPFAAALTLVIVGSTFVVAGSQPAMSEAVCTQIDTPVTLPDDPLRSTYNVHALLCEPDSPSAVIQVLLAGATESGLVYWDFPHVDFYSSDARTYRPLRARYSYVGYLADAGYASLTVDRIGTGESGYPPSEQVTIESNAAVVHQLVERLRSGTLSPLGTRYASVIGVGRSLSGPIVWAGSLEHNDYNGVIVQSFRRHQTAKFPQFAGTFTAAQTEARLANRPAGYLTTRPGTRAEFFFKPGADPAVIEHEERTRDTITSGEVRTFVPSFELSREVAVPVLSIVGAYDELFCEAPECPEAESEASFFNAAPCFESHIIPDSGHDMNLQARSRSIVFPLLLDWVVRNFGGQTPPCSGA